MAFEKLRQVLLARLRNHRQVATIHHTAFERNRGFDQILKMIIQLGSAAGYIQRRDVRDLEKAQYRIDRFPAHHLRTSRSRFDMTVNASLVAVFAHIHLEHVDTAPVKTAAV
jgi:hypothetical protein